MISADGEVVAFNGIIYPADAKVRIDFDLILIYFLKPNHKLYLLKFTGFS